MAAYLWLLPGRLAPAGYLPTGVVSRWQDTGRIRAELWEAALCDDVRPGGDPRLEDEPVAVRQPEAVTPPPAPFTATGEKRT